jgi:hypothetical protein
VLDATNPISYRNDVAREVLADSAGEPWQPASPIAIELRLVGARRASAVLGKRWARMPLPLAADKCFRLEATANVPGFAVDFSDPKHRATTTHLMLDGDKALAGDTAGEYSTGASGAGANARSHFALIVGRRAAAIVVGDRIRAVVDIPDHATVGLRPLRPDLTLRGVRVGAAPSVSC